MNIWDVLGISPTKNVKEIKRVYAVIAKLIHPEEHPEEFQKLHEAYRLALEYAECETHPIEQYDVDFADAETEETVKSDYDFDKAVSNYRNQLKEKAVDVTAQTIKQLETFYNSNTFVSADDYLKLFNSTQVQEIVAIDVFPCALYAFLKSHFISDSLGYAVYMSFCTDCLLDSDNKDNYNLEYEKIAALVCPKYYAYVSIGAKEKRNKKYNIAIAAVVSIGMACAAFCFYMAYKDGQLDEIIRSFKGLII